MPRAHLDPALSIRVLGVRELRYTDRPELGEDRPLHVRAASGLVVMGGRMAIIQDDCAFVAYVTDKDVSAIPLPRGPNGRRRFEAGLGNKMDKLDFEACVAVGDELWAFGSGSAPARERIAVVGYATRILESGPLYRHLREELSGPSASDSFLAEPKVNVEGATIVGKELWLFHRGNTGPHDVGPTILKMSKAAFADWLAAKAALPEITASVLYDLGSVEGVRLGFTDAVTVGSRVFFLAAAEASANAIDDGRVISSQVGVIDLQRDTVRTAALEIDGQPIKAEGLAFDPNNPAHAWITIDPDDVDTPARLYQIELVGPW